MPTMGRISNTVTLQPRSVRYSVVSQPTIPPQNMATVLTPSSFVLPLSMSQGRTSSTLEELVHHRAGAGRHDDKVRLEGEDVFAVRLAAKAKLDPQLCELTFIPVHYEAHTRLVRGHFRIVDLAAEDSDLSNSVTL